MTKKTDGDGDRLKVPISFTEALRGILKVRPPKAEPEERERDRDADGGAEAEAEPG